MHCENVISIIYTTFSSSLLDHAVQSQLLFHHLSLSLPPVSPSSSPLLPPLPCQAVSVQQFEAALRILTDEDFISLSGQTIRVC